MRTVLLVTDLEGVAGVETVDALIASSPAYPMARELLTAEVLAAVAGLRDAGYERVRISDSHRPGADAPNVIAARLPPGVDLDWRGDRGHTDDAFAPELFDGVSAVAALGMHAAAGSRGFAGHTFNVHCAWAVGDRNLNESDLLLGLAAELGIPALFVSGDDVLAGELAGRVACVVTKTATSIATARSRLAAEVYAGLRAAASGPPRPAPRLPDGRWTLRFKSRWSAALLSGARRIDDFSVELDGGSVRERYAHGQALLEQTAAPMQRALRGHPGEAFREDVIVSLARGFTRAAPPDTGDAANRALAALLRLTDGDASWQRSERALALHMLAGHAPAFFTAAGLAPVLEDALARLSDVPGDLPLGLDTREATLRVDAVYLRAEHGLRHARLDGVVEYLKSIGQTSPLYAWLMWQQATQIGLCRPRAWPTRPFRAHDRVFDLYWLTHLFILATRYLRVGFDPTGWAAEIEELALAVPWALATGRLDLAAELAMCLQLAGEADGEENRAVIRALLEKQRPDGRFVDPALGAEADDSATHTTMVAVVALARYSAAST